MATTPPEPVSNQSAQWLRGFGLVLLATLALSMQNVIARIAQSPTPLPILGNLLELGGYIAKDTDKLQVSLLILLLRVSIVVPLLWLVLPMVKPGAWQEARDIIVGSDRHLKLGIITAGIFLFLSQTSIYLSISNVGPATAVTIFFIYPTVTTLLAWRLFGDRPSWLQWVAIGLIYAGCTWLTFSPPPQKPPAPSVSSVSVAKPSSNPRPIASPSTSLSPAPSPTPSTSKTPKNAPQGNFTLGVFTAVMSGIVFAMEGIIAQSCFSKINPATFTGMIFTVEWLALLLATIPFIQVDINSGLILMGGLLSLATLSGYLFNNFGIKAIGASSTAIIGSSGPAVTAILAFIILGDGLTLPKIFSIVLVTLGVVLMNWAKAYKNKQLAEEK